VKSAGFAAIFLSAALFCMPGSARAHEYPTPALADYVFACMGSNGQTREILERCSCSIDVIASIVPYERYVQAETILRMRQVSGEKSVIFRDGSEFKKIVDELRGAQAEAEIRCF
jgi:hypothetical protein